MTDATPSPSHRPLLCRAKTELRALGRCVMPHDGNSHRRKATTLLLVAGWLVWSIGLAHGALERGETVMAGYTIYELFSFLVIYMFARLHDLEVSNLLGADLNTSDGGDDDE